MSSEEHASLSQTVEGLVKSFAAFFTFAYVCGYLIATSHLEELGIRSGSVNLIRAKYIWLGFLYLLPLFCVAAATSLFRLNPVISFEKFSMRLFHWGKRRRLRFRNPYSWAVLSTALVISVRMMLFDAQSREDTAWMASLTLGAFLFFQLVHRAEIYQSEELSRLTQSRIALARFRDLRIRISNEVEIERVEVCIDRAHDYKYFSFLIILISVACNVYYILDRTAGFNLPHPQWGLLAHRPDIFVLLTYFFTVLALQVQVSTAFHRDSLSDRAASLLGPSDQSNYSGRVGSPDAPELASRKRARWVARTVVMLILFLASIHGFTHVVYPLIPPERGGGMYFKGPVTDVCLRSSEVYEAIQEDGVQHAQPDTFCRDGISVDDLVILEEDSDTIYAASIYDPGAKNSNPGAKAARSCGLQNWHVGTNGPAVLSLKASSVIGTRDKGTAERYCAELDSRLRSQQQANVPEPPK